MAVSAIPVTFEGCHIAPSDDGAAWAACMTDGISSGCDITKSGSTITITAGKIVAAGRTVRVPSSGTLSSSNDYARVILTIDLTQSGDSRAAITVQSRTSSNLWSSLTKDDINGSGTKYQLVLAIISGGNIVWKCGRAHSRGFGTQVTIATGDWSSNACTKYVDGILSDTNAIVTYAPSSKAVWEANGVYAYSQANGTITFKCATTPGSSVTANILLY
jgi:hypothetical protein